VGAGGAAVVVAVEEAVAVVVGAVHAVAGRGALGGELGGLGLVTAGHTQQDGQQERVSGHVSSLAANLAPRGGPRGAARGVVRPLSCPACPMSRGAAIGAGQVLQTGSAARGLGARGPVGAIDVAERSEQIEG
ncbi:MAG: hypothetical protein ACK559_36950, partial [bacterium]